MRAPVLLVLLAACSSAPADPSGTCSGDKCDHIDAADAAHSEDAAPGQSDPCADPGEFPAWISGGAACGAEPAIQIHRLGPDTYILRQSLCTSPEAPFLYLLFGDERVLLEDTGDDVGVPIPLVETVEEIIAERLAERGQTSIELVVVNSHAHGDHAAYNDAFAARPGTTVVGSTVADLIDFFAIANWPEDRAELDLGGRVIDVLPIPGHQSAHIALYDRRRGLMLTGDSLYPGRLFVRDDAAYTASIARLVEFTTDRPVCHVLGTHIEMTREPGEDYAFGTTSHPNEHALELSRAHLLELDAALEAMGGDIVREVHDDFIIFPL